MAKEGYLRDGLVLFSGVGAFKIEQRSESKDRLILRMERVHDEICALPAHPQLQGNHILLDLFGEDVDELCRRIREVNATLKGDPYAWMR